VADFIVDSTQSFDHAVAQVRGFPPGYLVKSEIENQAGDSEGRLDAGLRTL
jgi:hypothetical protein